MYALLQMRRLPQIKRLMDHGYRPGKLLTPDEAGLLALDDTLGLLMVEALLVIEDAYPVLLAPQTPIDEIVRAARIKQADVVCLSFSTAYSPALAAQGLRDLRRALPAETGLWAGGYGIKPIRKPIDGVCMVPEFRDLYDCLASWQSGKGNNTGG